MKTLFLWALLVVIPLTNVRMICIDHPRGKAGMPGVSEPADCSEVCPRDAAPRPAPETGCVLVAGGCSAVTAFVVALPAPQTAPLSIPPATPVSAAPETDGYRPPAPSLVTPPPKP